MRTRAGGRRAALFLALSAAWISLWCTPVLAHAGIEGRSPADGAKLEEVPETVRLRFNESVRAEFSPLEVRDADGGRVDLDDARTDPENEAVLEVGLEALPPGDYEVEYRATSFDGHVVDGSYTFAVVAGGGDAEPPSQKDPATDKAPETAGVGPERMAAFGLLGLGAIGLVALAVRAATRERS